ncbi:hypothetical protein NWE48_23640 [Escherichia coli]|nr:hypothetical protein [Escherichia coli]
MSLQHRDLRRPDIRNKRHVPAQAAAVDTGGDCTRFLLRLAGDTELHVPSDCVVTVGVTAALLLAITLTACSGKCIAERIGHPRSQRVFVEPSASEPSLMTTGDS